MRCLFSKCVVRCQGHVLSAPTPKGELLGVHMGAGRVITLGDYILSAITYDFGISKGHPQRGLS